MGTGLALAFTATPPPGGQVAPGVLGSASGKANQAGAKWAAEGWDCSGLLLQSGHFTQQIVVI